MNSPVATHDIRRDLVALLPRLRRFALSLTAETSTAETLVMDVCKRAIQKSHHWKGTGRLESWVFTLIRTAWNEDSRKRGRSGPTTAGPASSARENNTPSPLALLCLPDGLASALLLVDTEGFSYLEAASILGIPSGVLASRVCAARMHLCDMPPEKAERRA